MNKPTVKFKRKLLASKILEKQGNVGEAMREMGYSDNYANNPQQITRSKSWEDLMDKYLPEEKIIKVHKQQLHAKRPVICDKEISLYPDNDARIKAIDLSYKLRGKYAPEKVEDVTPYGKLSNKELADLEKSLLAKVLARKAAKK